MKIGILSDIHSNIYAFKECVAYLEKVGCDEYLLLGDYISDTPYTRTTLDYLYDFISNHTCTMLRGNREEYMLSQKEIRKNNSEEDMWIWNSASGNLLFAYQQLQEKDFEFFHNLPITVQYVKEGYPSITCCHGSPNNSRELLELYGDNTIEWLEKISTDYLVCAHTHFPGELNHRGKHYFNPGCVGIAIHDYGFAQCMLLESKTEGGKQVWKPVFLKIPYDNKQVVADIIESGLLEKAGWFMNSNIQILLTGVDNSASLVALAGTLAKEAGELAGWPRIEEKYFMEAARRLGVPDYR